MIGSAGGDKGHPSSKFPVELLMSRCCVFHDTGFFPEIDLKPPTATTMKKIALLSSGTILLLGGLFYGFSLKNQRPSRMPIPSVSDSAKSAKSTASAPLPTGNTSPDSVTRSETSDQTGPVVGTGVKALPPGRTAGIHETATRTSERDPSKAAKNSIAPSGDEPAQSQAPIGVRLAPDVRLPAAAMPLDFKVTPVAQKAIDQILADFYQDLASPPKTTSQAGGLNPADATNDPIEESETGELTRVVTNGPAVEAARKRADGRFKALFGFDAYNRLTMRTQLERRLPMAPPSPVDPPK